MQHVYRYAQLKRRLFTLEETNRPTGVRHGITCKQPLCNMRGIVRFSRFVGQLLYVGSAEFMRFSVLACACCSHNTDSIFPKAVLKNLRPKSATSNEELNKMFIVEAAIAVFSLRAGAINPSCSYMRTVFACTPITRATCPVLYSTALLS